MARPKMEGLEYFPHDVYASSDEKMEPLILLYGAKGYAFYFIHLEYIYRNKELEFDISDAETREVIQQKLHLNSDEYNLILQTAFKKKCFDENYYKETGKLTSNGIKKRAASVLEKRDKMRLAYERRNSCGVSAAETTHIKKSKVKKSKVNINKEDVEDETGKIFKFYQENIGLITPFQSETILQFVDEGIEPNLIIEIMVESLGKSDKWSWIKKVLNNSIEQNIKTLERFEAKKVENKSVKETTAAKAKLEPKKSAFELSKEEANRRLKEEGFI